MRLATVLASAALATTGMTLAPAAIAQPVRPPCAGVEYVLPSGAIACAPADQVVVQEDNRSLLDRILGRNRPAPTPATPAPVVVTPAPAPAQPPPAPGGGNTGGTDPVVGPLGPVISPGTGSTGEGPAGINLLPGGAGACSPGAQIAVLGTTYACPPSGVIPAQVLYPSVVGQPPAAGSTIVYTHLPVTH